MSRKHFISLARAMAYARPNQKKKARFEQWEKDVQAIASVCSEANDRFDQPKFVAACKQW